MWLHLAALVTPLIVLPVKGGNVTINLWPLPKSHASGITAVCLADDFKVTVTSSNPPQDLWDAIGRTSSHIWNSKHEYLSTTFGSEFFTDRSNPCQHWLHSLELEISSDDRASITEWATQEPHTRMAGEAYNLTVPIDGTATLTSDTALGLFRGLTTFENMWFYLAPQGSSGDSLKKRWSGGEALYAPFAPYDIQDYPSFPWRGQHLDTSRNFFTILTIQKVLDTMAMVKMTTFYWHITDSQSWPLELPNHMDLAQNAAYSPARHYSQDDVKGIVAYAGARGIDVIMEIDTPGHTATIGASHPEMVACYDASGWAKLANEPPPGQLKLIPEVAQYTKGVLADAISLVDSKYFSTGGDEINLACYNNDMETQEAWSEYGWTFESALDNFTAITHGALHEAGKTPVVWEEMVDSFGNITSLVPETVVLVWIDSSHVRQVADMGYSFVHASSNFFYLDCGLGGWIGMNGGGNSWCDPFKSWATIYSFDPFANLTEAQQKQVLGGQTSLWTEQTGETNVETVMWPRAAALAELFWSGPGANGSYPRTSNDALPRMHDIRYRMVDRGVKAEPLQPEWCALRPGKCLIDS